MKKYQKAQMIAKNLPTGSYAAGCPEFGDWSTGNAPGIRGNKCAQCQRAS